MHLSIEDRLEARSPAAAAAPYSELSSSKRSLSEKMKPSRCSVCCYGRFTDKWSGAWRDFRLMRALIKNPKLLLW